MLEAKFGDDPKASLVYLLAKDNNINGVFSGSLFRQ